MALDLAAGGGVAGAMWLTDDETGDLRILHARSPELAAMPLETTSMASDLPVALVARTGEALYIRSLDERDRCFPELAGRGSVASFVALPLFGTQDVAGVLNIGTGIATSVLDLYAACLAAAGSDADPVH